MVVSAMVVHGTSIEVNEGDSRARGRHEQARYRTREGDRIKSKCRMRISRKWQIR